MCPSVIILRQLAKSVAMRTKFNGVVSGITDG